jgi:hypothetical protein
LIQSPISSGFPVSYPEYEEEIAMGKKKGKLKKREKKAQNPPKPRTTTVADQYNRLEVAPLEQAYKQALQAKAYGTVSELYMKLTEARRHHRVLIFRRERIPIGRNGSGSH